MGKKGKIGKQRKDKYYQLAKETGYRSRAAFKLIQLNRKFSFLESSKVLIDLCAAPGGWLQVAQKFMPVSSVIIGVDLVPIKPIHNVITLQEDITTQKCRTELKKNLKTWKADVVLHDGAPNVGKNWLHDAFGQNQLTLSALHLASEFLMKGGCFVTKVFRSKDYNALIWVLNKLFKKVFTTKPLASRSESAEIFIVCQNYLAPNKIDPKFFDPTYVFAEVKENEEKITANDLLKASTKPKKAKAEGYEDGKILLYNKLNASEFVDASNYAELLSKSNEIVLDTDFIKNHSSTTDEIIECIKDIKVLGKKELVLLINWRRTLKNEMKKIKKNENSNEQENNGNDNEKENPDDDNDDEEGFTKEDIEEIDTFENEQIVKLKRAKKKVSKEKKKLKERMDLKMVLENDQLVQEEQDLFSLNKIKKKINIDKIKDVEPDMMDQENESDQDNEEQTDFNNDFDLNVDEDDDDDDDDNGNNELLTDLSENGEKNNKMTKWLFDRPIFKKFESDDQDTLMLLNSIEMSQNNDNTDNDNSNKNIEKDKNIKDSNEFKPELDTDDDSDEDDEKMTEEPKLTLSKSELAIGSELIKSTKRKLDLMDDAWNRYMHDDIDMVPSWFKKEEDTYCRKPINIPVDLSKPVKDIKSTQNKKALEAKARKKKRTLRRLEKARIKAESLTEDPSMSNKEKAEYIRRIYKRASTKNDKQPKLVVAKKQFGNRRPPGVKGRYKIVDPRMKKDKRAKQGKDVPKNKKNKIKTNKNNKRKRQKI